MVDPRQRSTLVVIICCCFSGFAGCGTRFQSDLGVSCVADSGDRERLFMKFGAPDEIEYPGDRPRPKEEGEADGFPFEIWQHAHLDGIGDNVNLEFVDTDVCGDYKLADRESLIGGSPNEE